MPQIETERLLLRPFTLDDVDAYYTAIRSDADVMRYLPGGKPQPREKAEALIRQFIAGWENSPFGGLAVIHKADDTLIGQAGLMGLPGTDKVELFYAFAKTYWGQGLAPEAARAVLRFGFEHAGLEEIVAVFEPGNAGSERVMIKVGMMHQGLIAAYDTELPCYAVTCEEFDYGDGAYHFSA